MDDAVRLATPISQGACSAFALGWNVGEVGAALGRDHPEGGPAASMPLTGELTREEQLDQLGRRIRARLRVLREVGDAEEPSGMADDDVDAFAQHPDLSRLRGFHTTLLNGLMAEDSRLGKSYSLGLELWAISGGADADDSRGWYDPHRVERAKRHLADLHTVLPDHAAMGVLGSLLMWEQHAAQMSRSQATTLPEQARRWRALLSGEKSATDDLSLADYVEAGRRALQNGKKIAGSIVGSVLFGSVSSTVVVAVLLLLLVAGVAVALSVRDPSAQVVGGGALALLSGAGGLGFVKRAWDGVEGLWENAKPAIVDAALDITVAAAITQLPARENERALRSGIQRTLHPTGLSTTRA